jgi:DNA-directed RNA polymerase subunit RPC12/RpoP
MASNDIKLKVIPKPAPKSRVVIEAYKGEGEQPVNAESVNYVCGNCNSIIVENVIEGSMKGQVVKCNSCGSYNEFA